MGRKYRHSKFDRNDPARLAKERIGFKAHLVTYISVISFLWVIAFVTGSWHHPWPIYPMMSWGIGLVAHYYAAYRKYDKWVEREMRKEGYTIAQNNDSNTQHLDYENDAFELRPPAEKVRQPRDSDFI